MVKGRTTSTTSSLGGELRKGTLPYTPVKSRPSPLSILTTKTEEKERKRCLFSPFLGCLATYVGCVLCANLSRLGGHIHPTTIDGQLPVPLDALISLTRVFVREEGLPPSVRWLVELLMLPIWDCLANLVYYVLFGDGSETQ